MEPVTPANLLIQTLNYRDIRAQAWVSGDQIHPKLSGVVNFFETIYGGVLMEAEFFGLPVASENRGSDFFAMHIHEFGDCTPPFDQTGEHYNPDHAIHPWHAGDLLPLLGNQGYAWMSFYDKRFTIPDIIGRSVIVHSRRDDFTTQPSGDAGQKIGCGIIRYV